LSRKEAEQPHKGLLTEQQGIHAVDRKQALPSVAQEGWDERHHLTLERLPLDVVHRVDQPKLPEEAEEFIRESPFIQPIYDINQWFGVQPPYPRASSWQATSQFNRSAGLCVISPRLSRIDHLPPLHASQQ
jgi:hypothetical protein